MDGSGEPVAALAFVAQRSELVDDLGPLDGDGMYAAVRVLRLAIEVVTERPAGDERHHHVATDHPVVVAGHHLTQVAERHEADVVGNRRCPQDEAR